MLNRKYLVGIVFGIGAIGLSLDALAGTSCNPGLYVGVSAGWVDSDYGSPIQEAVNQFNIVFPGALAVSTDDGNLGGRAYIGWQFNPYIAVETGYAFLQNNDLTVTSPPVPLLGAFDVTEKTSAWDLLFKASLPFSSMTGNDNPFSFYVKAGGAYEMSEISGSANSTLASLIGSTSGDTSENTIVPVAGAGLECNFTPDFSADISYLRYFGSDTSANDLIVNNEISAPTVQMAMIGVRYLFA